MGFAYYGDMKCFWVMGVVYSDDRKYFWIIDFGLIRRNVLESWVFA